MSDEVLESFRWRGRKATYDTEGSDENGVWDLIVCNHFLDEIRGHTDDGNE